MKKLGLPRKVLLGFLLSILAGVTLAAVYVFGGGTHLVGYENFGIVDNMLFLTTITSFAIGIGGTFYFFTGDVSTAISPVLGSVWSLYSGFEDLAVYFFCIPKNNGPCSDVSSFPVEWTWLNDSHIGVLTSFFGFDNVTTPALFTSVVVLLIISLILVKILTKFEARFYGINI